ncbi:hypothetical protein BFL35_11215 [Clavibacter michiganensis]|nr:hypothetical protein BFL35_11215 [Clavibacter michiganensis]
MRHPHELRVDAVRGGEPGRVEEVDHPVPDDDVLLERHRPLLGDDDVRLAAHGLQPVAELLGVRDGRAQRDHPHALREVDDDLLPDGAAEAVGQVVHLVHDHEGEVAEEVGVRVEHVAQHLGRHDDDARAAVDVGVAGEQAHLVRPVLGHQLGVLLVAERLHRRRVEDLRARPLHGEVHGELRDDGLAGAGGRRDEHAPPVLEGLRGGALERVEVEAQPAREGLEEREAPAGPGGGVAFGGRELVCHDDAILGSGSGRRPGADAATPAPRGTGVAGRAGQGSRSSASDAAFFARRRSLRSEMPAATR